MDQISRHVMWDVLWNVLKLCSIFNWSKLLINQCITSDISWYFLILCKVLNWPELFSNFLISQYLYQIVCSLQLIQCTWRPIVFRIYILTSIFQTNKFYSWSWWWSQIGVFQPVDYYFTLGWIYFTKFLSKLTVECDPSILWHKFLHFHHSISI